MKNRLLLLFLLLLQKLTSLHSQNEYLVGSSMESIEPETSTFSVALAGYGAPRDGRFTLEWGYHSKIPSPLSVSAAGKILYIIDKKNDLLEINIDDPYKYESLGTVAGAAIITAMNKRLYMVLDNGNLEVRAPQDKNAQTYLLQETKKITSLTSYNNKLYAILNQNELSEITISGKKFSYNIIGAAPDAISIAIHHDMIYALSADNNIWKRKRNDPENNWIKIARYNGITYDIKIKQILIIDDRLYGIEENGNIHLARHSTQGDLHVSALAIKKKEKVVIIAGIDCRGFDHMLINAVKTEIKKRRNIPASAIFINASHTHFAPVVQAFPSYGAYMRMPDSLYLQHVKKRVIRAIEKSIDQMVPATIYFGRGQTNIGHNRSSANKQTPYDSTVDAIKIEDRHRKIQTVLFSTGCHPVARNTGKESYTMTANYPGVTRNLIQNRTNAKSTLFLQGCAGDINPRSDDYNKTGMDLSLDIMKILNSDMEKIEGDISYTLDTILIPVQAWNKEQIEQFKLKYSNQEGNVSAEKNVRWADMMIAGYNNHSIPSTWPVYVHIINIGNWKLVGLSREAVTEYGMAIKNLWPDKLVSVAGYTNDETSYLPRDWHIQNKTYEGYDSFFWHSQPAILPENVFDTIIEQIKRFNR